MDRNIKEILYIILRKYEKPSVLRYGLCYTAELAHWQGKLTTGEYHKWEKYWEAYTRTRKRFYNLDGDTTTNKGMYAWKINDRASRLNWLRQRIYKA